MELVVWQQWRLLKKHPLNMSFFSCDAGRNLPCTLGTMVPHGNKQKARVLLFRIFLSFDKHSIIFKYGEQRQSNTWSWWKSYKVFSYTDLIVFSFSSSIWILITSLATHPAQHIFSSKMSCYSYSNWKNVNYCDVVAIILFVFHCGMLTFLNVLEDFAGARYIDQ